MSEEEGVDGLPVPGDQAVSQMSHLATLKRHSSNSLEVEFLLSHKRRRSSYPRGDYRGAAGPSVPEDQQETQPLTNSVGAPLQSAASPELQQPDLRQKPPIPKCPPAVPPALLPQGKPSLAQFPEAANCSTLPGNSSMDPHAASSAFCIPPSFAIEKFILLEMSGNADTSPENSSETIYYPALLGSIRGSDTDSSSLPLLPNFALDKVMLVETPEKAETSLENSCQTVYYQTSLGNDIGLDPASSSQSIPPSFVLKKCCLYEMMGKEETSLENNTKMTNCPPVLENDSGQDTSAYFFIPSSFGYLGDPKRNVRVLDAHLLTAQRKANPRHAVRYLIHILFSKKILTDGWVGVNSQGLRPLDANKMAALREHLQSVFPDYDLREYGNYWQTCIADINSLISCLRSEANTIRQKAGDNSKGPTNPDTPVAADLNGTRYGKGSESSSQLSQQAAASETRGNGNSQHNSSACPKGIKEYSTDNSLVSYEALEYLGNPDRNIQLPHSVLSMAKVKSRPELSAIYLIRNLFTEEVLIRSNIYGSLGHGLYALNPNRINALREFLGDAYPTCDLSESGYDWKLCVTAINSCIRSLRCDFKKSTSKA
uniref:BEN domain-containing protein n=1 Tax=Felis catus TaxID=9685 RepID=A0ABI7VXT4_FELCA